MNISKQKAFCCFLIIITAVNFLYGCNNNTENNSTDTNKSDEEVISDASSYSTSDSSGVNSLDADSQDSLQASSLVSSSAPESIHEVSSNSSSSATLSESEVKTITKTSPTGIKILMPDSGLKDFDPTIFGLSTENRDNTEAFNVALYYCKENPGTRMVIPKGRYVFNNTTKLNVKDLKNIIIDGQDSEFIFKNLGFFEILNCETIEIKNLVIDWDWGFSRPANLVKIKSKGTNYVDLEFVEVTDIEIDDVTFFTMNQYDSETLTPGCANGKEYWQASVTPTKTEKIANNVIRAYGMPAQYNMQIGEHYLLRNFACLSHAFNTNNTHNITFSKIKVYSAPGMAFVFSGGSDSIFLNQCTVDIRPGEESRRHISTQADGLHCINTGGNIWVDGCDFSFMGDDGINIHDNVGVIYEVLSSESISVQNNLACEVGDSICFLKSNYAPTGFTAKITSKVASANNTWRLEFDKELPSLVKENGITYNTKYNSGNYYINDCSFRNKRARGILAQASNGVIENCRFYRTQGAAILVITDIAAGLWSEGTGVDTLTVRNNTFERCNVNDWTALIDIHSSVFGSPVENKIFKNLLFENNTFIDFPSNLFHICSAENVVIKNNVIRNSTFLLNSKSSRGGITIELSKNITIKDNRYIRSSYMTNDIFTPIILKGVTGLSTSNNKMVEE